MDRAELEDYQDDVVVICTKTTGFRFAHVCPNGPQAILYAETQLAKGDRMEAILLPILESNFIRLTRGLDADKQKMAGTKFP